MMTDTKWWFESCGRGLFAIAISEFGWKDWRKPRKSSSRVSGSSANIQTVLHTSPTSSHWLRSNVMLYFSVNTADKPTAENPAILHDLPLFGQTYMKNRKSAIICTFAHFRVVVYSLSSTKETKWRQITCPCLVTVTVTVPNVTCCRNVSDVIA
jgi:hypothetical protein